MSTTPTTEDRIWSVLAHLSALSLGIGILLPVVGWSDQRRKSNYATFQCLQALGYQSVGFTVWVLSYLVVIILGAVILLATNAAPQSPGMIVFSLLVFGLFALYLVFPIIAAVACALGRDFRYPVMGEHLRRYLAYEPSKASEEKIWLNEDHEMRWVAAMGHFSILIVLWGMLAPLTAWILQGKQSTFLRFQSMQTLAYQAVATILFLVGGFISAFGLVLVPFMLFSRVSSAFDSPTSILGLIIFIGLMLIAMLILLVVPLLHILGQWAGYRVLKGENYRYPLIGKLVERQLSRNLAIEETSA
jgi:uncharacterized protein